MLKSVKPVESLTRRLMPLYVAAMLQNMFLWVPVEKLFMNEIGFDAATVGLMAAAYAALVPIVEIPSGVIADRWSRRGVLMIAGLSLAVSTLVGGLSHNVPTYIAGAMVLGVYFAMYSGTMESVVYDTVLEVTGSGASYARQIGRMRLVESVSLVTSALAGGWLAGVTSTRLTYFVTLPFLLASLVALLWFREPTLHKAGEHTSLRSHLATTYRTLVRRADLLPVVLLAVLTAMVTSVIFEFGPLWLVALSAAAVLYGPFWAGLVSTFGLGGLLAGRIKLDRPATLATVVILMLLSAAALTTSRNLLVIAAAQTLLALLVVAASIHASQLLHDAVPSTIRSGVASGVGAVSWIAFLPFALGFGAVSKGEGVHTAAWMIVAATVLAGAVLVKVAVRRPAPCPEPCPEQVPELLAA
ncbi:MAG: MFS transporter [Kribbellaceae bacterium]